MANGEHIEVAKAFVTIVPSLEGSQKTISEEMGAVTDAAAKETGEKSGKTLGENLAKGLKTTAAVIAGAMAAATGAAIATGKAFVNAANETAAYGDEVDKTAQKLGLSNQAYQEWDYVMKICGTEMSSMTTGLKTLTNKLDDAKNGSEDAQAMFESLGISMEDISTMSREDLFEKTIAGLQGMADSTDRAALANDLFGKSGQNLAPLFNMTAEETQALIDKANDLGMVMSDEGVKASAAYKDSLTTLQGTIKGLKNNIMTQFMPSLTAITEGFADAIKGKGTEKMTAGIKDLMKSLKELAPVALQTVSEVGISLIQGIGPLLPDLVSTIFNLLISAITTVTLMIPDMMPSIISGIEGIMVALLDALPIIIQGLTTLVMSIVTWLASEDNVKNLTDGIVAMVAELVNSFAMILPVLLPAIVTIITEVCKSLTDPENVKLLLDAVLTLVGAIFMALVNMVPEFIELIKSLLENAGELVGEFLFWIVPKVAQGLEDLINNIKKWGSDFINKIVTWFKNVSQKFSDFGMGLLTKFKELPGKVMQIGKNLVEGLWNGINDKISWVKQKISNMGSQITSAIKKVFGIASPSKLWKKEVGAMLALGIGEGFSDEMEDVKADMQAEASGLTTTMTTQVEAYGANNSDVYGGGTVYNGGNISINVYGAEGQSVTALADAVAYKLQEMTRRKEIVYG